MLGLNRFEGSGVLRFLKTEVSWRRRLQEYQGLPTIILLKEVHASVEGFLYRICWG